MRVRHFGSDIPPIGPEDYRGSWRTTLHAIAEEWEGEGRVERHAAHRATAINELIDNQQLFGVGSPEALADGIELQPPTAGLRRRGAQLPES
ncbi:hypothetical protein [Streptomyces sp. NPDC057426]|uniref:hypothetical protein n=1 Tax=Streptomyces sp. NPDC057426 TaxID=3346128 RepID=UPI0036B0959C